MNTFLEAENKLSTEAYVFGQAKKCFFEAPDNRICRLRTDETSILSLILSLGRQRGFWIFNFCYFWIPSKICTTSLKRSLCKLFDLRMANRESLFPLSEKRCLLRDFVYLYSKTMRKWSKKIGTYLFLIAKNDRNSILK